jgi:hypothetical protein
MLSGSSWLKAAAATGATAAADGAAGTTGDEEGGAAAADGADPDSIGPARRDDRGGTAGACHRMRIQRGRAACKLPCTLSD